MTDILLFLVLALLLVVIVLQLSIVRRKVAIDLSGIELAFGSVKESYERVERAVRDEIGRNREESSLSARNDREEMGAKLKAVGDTLNQQLAAMGQASNQNLTAMRETIENSLASIQNENGRKLDEIRTEATAAAQKSREEVGTLLKSFADSVNATLDAMSGSQRTHLGLVVEQVAKLAETTGARLDAQRNAVDQRLQQMQTDAGTNATQTRTAIDLAMKLLNESVLNGMTAMSDAQQKQLEVLSVQFGTLTAAIQESLDKVKANIDENLKAIQIDNAKQLDQMRQTVDEKLQGTLEKRLGESFKQVSERLDAVHQGLGDMQKLATGVGDLKRVLTNVKARGTWGEVQLGAMLDEVLSPDQFAKNVATKDNGERVEFAVKLPGRSDDPNDVLWLPIDAKFPMEDYLRIVAAQDTADIEALEAAGRQLEVRVKGCAKDIAEKYINPPGTTDFAILFLPVEGLFAEVVRRVGLVELLQRDYRVMVAGPTTLWSILTSLQMGFRTLAIQQRSSEVWKVLGAVKTGFANFGVLLDGVKKKLTQAADKIDEAASRSRKIQVKLRDVEELQPDQAATLLNLQQVIPDGVPDEEAAE